MTSVVKWTIIGLIVLSTLMNIAMIGKPRKPTTPGSAIAVTVINTLIVVAMIVYWGDPS